MEISHKKIARNVYCHDIQSSLIAAFYQLAHLTEAGIAVDQTIRELIEVEQRRSLRRVWRDIERAVVDGQALSMALSRWPKVFDSTLVALLTSGEACGKLADACRDCHEYLEWQQNLKARLSAVLFYPLFALVIVLGVLIFLMVYLVPALEGLLLTGGYVFPWHAQLLLSVSQWVKAYWIYSLVVVCVGFLLISLMRVMVARIQLFIDGVILKAPLYGSLVFNLTLSRYCEICSRLYGSGIGLTDAMQKSESFIDNRTLNNQLRHTRLNLQAGKSLSTALSVVPMLSNIHIQVLCAGEASGSLVEALARTASQQRRLADLQISRLEKMIGPVILLLAGASLLWVVVSLLGPIYENAIESVILL